MTDVVRRIEVRGKSVGLENLKAKLDSVATAQGGVAVAADQMTRAQGSSESRFNRLQRSLDANYRAQEAIARATRTADAALAQGLTTKSRHAEVLDLITQKYGLNSVAANANARATRGAAAASHAMAAASRANSFQLRNLQFQMMDIAQGVPLLFQSPTHGLLNIANQGAQISQIYGPGEGGAARAFKEAAAMAGRFAARLGPVAIAIGVASVGMIGLQNDIEATTGASVSLGNITKGVFQELAASIASVAAPAIATLAPAFNAVANATYETLKTFGNSIINTFEYAYRVTVVLWKQLPAALGDVVFSAAQRVVDGTESMINGIFNAMNSLPQEWLPENLQLNIGQVDLPDIGNPFAGADKAGAQALADAYGVFDNDRFGDFFTRAGVRAAAMTDEVEGATSSLNGFQSAIRSIERATEGLWDQANFFGSEFTYDLLEHQKAQELLNAAMDAGIRITDQVRTQISGLASEYVSAVANLDMLKEAQDRFNAVVDFTKNVTGSFFSDFSNQLQKGASVWDSFKNAGLNALNTISSKLIEMASSNLVGSLFGSFNPGGGGGFLSSLLGSIPGFANGTNNAPGGLAWVGENGKELVNLPGGSQVIPNHALRGGNTNHTAASNSNVSMSISISGSSTAEEKQQMAEAILRQARAEMPGIALETYIENRHASVI